MPWLDANEATKLLGVSRATLYSYVSRGLVRSEPAPGDPRQRRYAREDVERMRRRSEERRDPQKAAARALHWGMPILESSISLMADGRLYYRGHDAAELARTRSLEEVAALIWTGAFDADIFGTPLHVVAGGRSVEGLPFITRAQSMLPLVAARDTLAWDLRPRAVAQTGWRILNLLTSVAAESSQLGETIDGTLASHWAPKSAAAPALIRAALILCADHELNVSSFTARCVASAGSHPYAAVVAGLAALEGPKHGGASARVESMLASMRRAGPLRAALAARVRRGESIDGFGHPLYRDGDPRARVLLDLLRERYPKSPACRFVLAFADAATKTTGEHPNVDFGLAAAAHVLELPSGSPLMLFAIGRSVGWVGHAIEQYATGRLIRPRAKYVGVPPAQTA